MDAGEKLLVVDDDRGILQALKWSLDSYDLVTATDRRFAHSEARRTTETPA